MLDDDEDRILGFSYLRRFQPEFLHFFECGVKALADVLIRRVRKLINQPYHLTIASELFAENVLSGSLDLDALELLIDSEPNAQVINLPRLHAKVYIADTRFALVTSSNLTRPGMESNYEYGVGIDDPAVVSRVRKDVEAYSCLGGSVSRMVISSLKETADELRADYVNVNADAARKLRQKAGELLDVAETRFLQAHVGNRTAHSLFADAIRYCLSKSPASTKALHEQVKSLLPDLCDDTRDLVINGQHFGKKWKHVVRTAQVFLRRKGVIRLENKLWRLVS